MMYNSAVTFILEATWTRRSPTGEPKEIEGVHVCDSIGVYEAIGQVFEEVPSSVVRFMGF